MPIETKTERELQIVREFLVREIRDAKRWSAVIEAKDALFRVLLRANSMIEEEKQHQGYLDMGSCQAPEKGT